MESIHVFGILYYFIIKNKIKLKISKLIKNILRFIFLNKNYKNDDISKIEFQLPNIIFIPIKSNYSCY